MAKIQVNSQKIVKKMKPMHGGGQPPVNCHATDEHFHYLTEAGIPYSRLHDVEWAFGGGKYVDIPVIFRNFDADENDPANYDFTFTDLLLEQLIKAGVEPYYRLGVTIECAFKVKHFTISPPKDFAKWARICEHVMAHYLEGWADGFHHKITYWEIWNEPDYYIGGNWQGTPDEFYRLYSTTAAHLKARFPYVKIGGYGHASGLYTAVGCQNPFHGPDDPMDKDKWQEEFFLDFLRYMADRKIPFDFFTWHGYGPTKHNKQVAPWIRARLDEVGFTDTELHLNEWNTCWREFGTAHHSAEIAGNMIALQHGCVDVCCIYDMRNWNAPFCPLFHPITQKPIHGYYSMVSFNQLYQLGNQVETQCDTEELYVLAASNGKQNRLLISNLTGKDQKLELNGVDLTDARFYVIDQERLLSWAPNADIVEKNMVLLIEW
jgi:hypothetical protein